MEGKKYPRPRTQVYGLQDRRPNTETASNKGEYLVKISISIWSNFQHKLNHFLEVVAFPIGKL